MKSCVITFPGSNCDRDMMVAIEKASGNKPQNIWHTQTQIDNDIDFIAIPGGFSYGDYLRSGAMSARSPIMAEVIRHAKRGAYILGVCNGFQILTESGLLPGTLMRNANLKFICKTVSLNVADSNSKFTSEYGANANVNIPIAHHDGNFITDEKTLKSIEDNQQVAFRYNQNPNGSLNNIAGVFSQNKRILGMMPHPERATDPSCGGIDGEKLFKILA